MFSSNGICCLATEVSKLLDIINTEYGVFLDIFATGTEVNRLVRNQ